MRISQTKEQRTKACLHGAQSLLIFIAACLTLAVYTSEGLIGSEIGFFFAVCFLSIPALIYQVMVPMWSRAWRFANVYAYAMIDITLLFLWFAAAVAVGVWNGRRPDDGDDKGNNNERSCTGGSATRCGISKAADGFGVIIALLFCCTATLAVNAVRDFRRTGYPLHSTIIPLQGTINADTGYVKDAWSPSIQDVESPSTPHSHDNHTHDHHKYNDDEHFEKVSEHRNFFDTI